MTEETTESAAGPENAPKRRGRPPVAKTEQEEGALAPSSMKAPPYVGANMVMTAEQEAAKFLRQKTSDPVIAGKRYYCLNNCGNGRYIRGRMYTISPDDPLVLAMKKDGKPMFFRDIDGE